MSANIANSPQEEVLVVSLLDGRAIAIDSSSGSILWSFDSGSPLITSQQADAPGGIHVFPGVDGGLYAYHGLDGGKAKLEVRKGGRAWIAQVSDSPP